MSSRLSARARGLLLLSIGLVAGACEGDGPACDPTNPLCATGGTSQVAAIAISSPIDSVLVTGSTVQLVAVTADARGVVVPAVVNWTSSDDGIATVGASGLVSALAAGSATITASSGSASATYPIRVVDARLASE
jgi:hypothetical protein